MTAMISVRAAAERSSNAAVGRRVPIMSQGRVAMNPLAEELPQLQDPTFKVRSAALARSDWTSMARGAFAANTVRAWRAAWELFTGFCRAHDLAVLPASARTVRRGE